MAGDLQAPECPAQWPSEPLDYLVYSAAASQHDEAGYRAAYVDGLRHVLGWLQAHGQRPRRCCSSPAPGSRADRWRLDRRGVAGAFPGLFRTDHARRRAGRAGQRDTGYPRAPGRHLRSAGVAAQPGAPGYRVVSEPPLYANRIHADDAAGLLAFLLRADAGGQALEDCYIGVDDAPVAMHEVVDYLRQRLGVSQWADEHSVRRAGSKRCSNRRARALGWVPRYPSYREGYAAVLGDA